MAQNQFAGGYQIQEKEPNFSEIQETKEPMKNIEQGGGIYKPFNQVKESINTYDQETLNQEINSDEQSLDSEKQPKYQQENTEEQPENQLENPDYKNEKIEEQIENPQEVPENQGENLENPIETKELNKTKLEENKYFPLIKRLYKSEKISEESYETITRSILENNGEFNLETISLELDEKKILDSFIIKLDEKNEKQNILDFGKDIKGLEELKDYNTELDKNGKFDSEILNIIGKNYLQITEGENDIDPKIDISTAIETTKNQILKDIKNIPKDSQTYLTSIENITSGNLKEQLEGINSLYILSYSSEGKLSKIEVNSYTKKRKEELKARAVEITKLMNDPKNKNDIEKIYKLNLEKVDIIAEAKEIDGGDIFEAGAIDKVSEKATKSKEEKS